MRENSQTVRKLFGEMAVQRGYCSRKDVDRALRVQRELAEGGTARMLGLIMLGEAMIDNVQFIDLLKELDTIVHDEEL